MNRRDFVKRVSAALGAVAAPWSLWPKEEVLSWERGEGTITFDGETETVVRTRAIKRWIGGKGYWDVGSNWEPFGVPDPIDNVLIDTDGEVILHRLQGDEIRCNCLTVTGRGRVTIASNVIITDTFDLVGLEGSWKPERSLVTFTEG